VTNTDRMILLRQGALHFTYRKIAETLANQLYQREGEPAALEDVHRAMSDWVEAFHGEGFTDAQLAILIDAMMTEVDAFFEGVRSGKRQG